MASMVFLVGDAFHDHNLGPGTSGSCSNIRPGTNASCGPGQENRYVLAVDSIFTADSGGSSLCKKYYAEGDVESRHTDARHRHSRRSLLYVIGIAFAGDVEHMGPRCSALASKYDSPTIQQDCTYYASNSACYYTAHGGYQPRVGVTTIMHNPKTYVGLALLILGGLGLFMSSCLAMQDGNNLDTYSADTYAFTGHPGLYTQPEGGYQPQPRHPRQAAYLEEDGYPDPDAQYESRPGRALCCCTRG